MSESENGKAAVYVAWATFQTVVSQLAEGVPTRIDRTVFPKFSGGVQNQIIAGLKFLGLIDESGKPSQSLLALAVEDESERKKILTAILKDRYSDLFALDLTKTTPGQLNEQMTKSYNVTGDSREKAVRFFLSAIDYVGIPVSAFIKNRRGSIVPSAVRRKKTAQQRVTPDTPPLKPTETNTANSRTVKLRDSECFLTLSTSVDAFKLGSADRKFVFNLIDQMEQYGGDTDDAPNELEDDIDENT